MKKQIKLTEQAYLCGGEYRIPTSEGRPSIILLHDRYEANAEDEDGKQYTVIFTMLDDYDPETMMEDCACDWYTPYAIIDEDGREVSDLVETTI